MKYRNIYWIKTFKPTSFLTYFGFGLNLNILQPAISISAFGFGFSIGRMKEYFW